MNDRRIEEDAAATHPFGGAVERLIAGRNGIDQPRAIRGKLRGMEKLGLIQYSDAQGWQLTPGGKRLLSARLRAAKRTKRLDQEPIGRDGGTSYREDCEELGLDHGLEG